MTRSEQLDKQIARLGRRAVVLNAISHKYWTARRIIFVSGVLLAIGSTVHAWHGDVADSDVVEDGRGMRTVVEIVQILGGLAESATCFLLNKGKYPCKCRRGSGCSAEAEEVEMAVGLVGAASDFAASLLTGSILRAIFAGGASGPSSSSV